MNANLFIQHSSYLDLERFGDLQMRGENGKVLMLRENLKLCWVVKHTLNFNVNTNSAVSDEHWQ